MTEENLSSTPSSPSCYRLGEIYWTSIGEIYWPVRIKSQITTQTTSLTAMLYAHNLNTTTSMPDWTACPSASVSDFLSSIPPAPFKSGMPDSLKKFNEELQCKFNLESTTSSCKTTEMDKLFIPGQGFILQHYFVTPLETDQVLYRPLHSLLPFAMHDPDPTSDEVLNSAIITAIHLSCSYAVGQVINGDRVLDKAYGSFFEKNPQRDSWALFPYSTLTSHNVSEIRLGTEHIKIGDLVRLANSTEYLLIDAIRSSNTIQFHVPVHTGDLLYNRTSLIDSSYETISCSDLQYPEYVERIGRGVCRVWEWVKSGSRCVALADVRGRYNPYFELGTNGSDVCMKTRWDGDGLVKDQVVVEEQEEAMVF